MKSAVFLAILASTAVACQTPPKPTAPSVLSPTAPGAADTLLEHVARVAPDVCGDDMSDPIDVVTANIDRTTLAVTDPEVVEQLGTGLSLVTVRCSSGAYNSNVVVFLNHPTHGLQPLEFALPTYDTSDASEPLGPPTGWTTTPHLTNPQIDTASAMVHAFLKWRGVGDAGRQSSWSLATGQPRLIRDALDHTYDGTWNPTGVFTAP